MIMSTEILKKTSINNELNHSVTSKKVNIDVLKRKVYEQERKEKLQGKIIIFAFCSLICILGFVISA